MHRILLASIIFLSLAAAETNPGGTGGTVTDASGGVIVLATVNVTSLGIKIYL